MPTEKNTIVFSLQARCRRMQSGLHNEYGEDSCTTVAASHALMALSVLPGPDTQA